MLLSAVSIPVLAVAGMLGLLASGKWRVAGVTALAVAIGLAVLALTTLALFSLRVQSGLVFFATTCSVPVAAYAWCHLAVAKRFRITKHAQSTAIALGLFPLLGLGLYLWLLVGCSAAKECL